MRADERAAPGLREPCVRGRPDLLREPVRRDCTCERCVACAQGRPLRGTGADEAFAQEAHQGGATSTRVTWRKGRYWGWLSVQGPKDAGDIEDATDLLEGFARRLPRT